MPCADPALFQAPYPPLALQPTPPAGEGVACFQAHPSSAQSECDTHKVMQAGSAQRAALMDGKTISLNACSVQASQGEFDLS